MPLRAALAPLAKFGCLGLLVALLPTCGELLPNQERYTSLSITNAAPTTTGTPAHANALNMAPGFHWQVVEAVFGAQQSSGLPGLCLGTNGNQAVVSPCLSDSAHRWYFDRGYLGQSADACLTLAADRTVGTAACSPNTTAQKWLPVIGFGFLGTSANGNALLAANASATAVASAPYLVAQNNINPLTLGWHQQASGSVMPQWHYLGQASLCLGIDGGLVRLVSCGGLAGSVGFSQTEPGSLVVLNNSCLFCDPNRNQVVPGSCFDANPLWPVTGMGNELGLSCHDPNGVRYALVAVGNSVSLLRAQDTNAPFWTFGGPAFLPWTTGG